MKEILVVKIFKMFLEYVDKLKDISYNARWD